MRDKIGQLIYRLMEAADGEHKVKIISYRAAERIKLFCLVYLIAA